ncbi:hypothetical protein PR048_030054 [Dryococelus australis]|uniref:Uncharacterized protein n=1 Tax=Dryococelus australis TaxID=614101 RepID=A0ABQ9GAI9_9NEOP|nr:hypothetical protein PR048_030054 [Dryococelus australis]
MTGAVRAGVTAAVAELERAFAKSGQVEKMILAERSLENECRVFPLLHLYFGSTVTPQRQRPEAVITNTYLVRETHHSPRALFREENGLACGGLLASHQGDPGFCKWESCRTMPFVGGFSRGSTVSPASSFRCCSILTSITLIGSEDHDVKSRPNLYPPTLHCRHTSAEQYRKELSPGKGTWPMTKGELHVFHRTLEFGLRIILFSAVDLPLSLLVRFAASPGVFVIRQLGKTYPSPPRARTLRLYDVAQPWDDSAGTRDVCSFLRGRSHLAVDVAVGGRDPVGRTEMYVFQNSPRGFITRKLTLWSLYTLTDNQLQDRSELDIAMTAETPDLLVYGLPLTTFLMANMTTDTPTVPYNARYWLGSRNGKISAIAYSKEASQHSPTVISENYGKPKSGWPDTDLLECDSTVFTFAPARPANYDKIDINHVYPDVAFAIGSQFIRHAPDDSEPIADLQGNKQRVPYCQWSPEVVDGPLPAMRQTGNTIDCMRSVDARHLSSKCCDGCLPHRWQRTVDNLRDYFEGCLKQLVHVPYVPVHRTRAMRDKFCVRAGHAKGRSIHKTGQCWMVGWRCRVDAPTHVPPLGILGARVSECPSLSHGPRGAGANDLGGTRGAPLDAAEPSAGLTY